MWLQIDKQHNNLVDFLFHSWPDGLNSFSKSGRLPHLREIVFSNMVMEHDLRHFGHTAHSGDSAPSEDHHHAVDAVIHKHPSDWKRLPGRHNHTRLRVIESNPRPCNIGPSHARKNILVFDCGHGCAQECAMKRECTHIHTILHSRFSAYK